MKQIFGTFLAYFLLCTCTYLVRADLVPGFPITLPIPIALPNPTIESSILPDPAFPILDVEHLELYAIYLLISTHCAALLNAAALAYCIANSFANLEADPFFSGNIAALALSVYKVGSEVCLAALEQTQKKYSS